MKTRERAIAEVTVEYNKMLFEGMHFGKLELPDGKVVVFRKNATQVEVQRVAEGAVLKYMEENKQTNALTLLLL